MLDKIGTCTSGNVTVDESITYFSTKRGTRSGLYLYNPRSEKQTMRFDNTQIWWTNDGPLVMLVQVYSTNGSSKLLRTFTLDIRRYNTQTDYFKSQVEFYTSDTIEVSYSIKVHPAAEE